MSPPPLPADPQHFAAAELTARAAFVTSRQSVRSDGAPPSLQRERLDEGEASMRRERAANAAAEKILYNRNLPRLGRGVDSEPRGQRRNRHTPQPRYASGVRERIVSDSGLIHEIVNIVGDPATIVRNTF